MCPGSQLQKSGFLHKYISSYLGNTGELSIAKAKGKLKDSVAPPTFAENTFLASCCVSNIKLPLRLKLQDKQVVLLYRKTAVSVLGVQELSLQLLQSPGSKELNLPWPPESGNQGVSLGGSHKNQDTRCEN